MNWQPDYRRDLRRRLQDAAEWVAAHPGSRQCLQDAINLIGAFFPDQFPADFRTQFKEITAVARSVAALSDAEVAAVGQKIIELHRDVLG